MTDQMREFSDSEKNRSYAKYHDREKAEGMVLIGLQESETQMTDYVSPTDAQRILELGTDIPHTVCRIDDGGLYISFKLILPRITAEMVNWWSSWVPLDSARYAIWAPWSHHSLGICAADREKLLNTQVPLTLKPYGMTWFSLKGTQRGRMEDTVRWLNPTLIGVDMGKLATANLQMLAQWTTRQDYDHPDHPNRFPNRQYSTSMALFKDSADGLELAFRCWLGWRYDYKGDAVFTIPPFVPPLPLAAAKGRAFEEAAEWMDLAVFLPGLFAEQGGPAVCADNE